MKKLTCLRHLMFLGLFPALLWACGAQNEASELDGGNPATVHRYNSNGSGAGITGTWFSQIGTRQADGSITLSGNVALNAEECLVFGPYNNYAPVNGIGHIDGQVDLILSGGSVKVDIVSNQVVLDSKIIDAPTGAARNAQTITLDGGVFSQPLTGVEVRVCQPRTKRVRTCEDIDAHRPPRCSFEPQLFLKVLETRLIFN